MKLLATITATLLITACSAAPSSGTNERYDPPKQPPRAASPARSIPDTKLFISLLKTEAPAVYYALPDADLVDLGLGMCTFLDNGNSVADMSSVLYRFAMDNGYSQYLVELASLGAASIVALCPHHGS